MGIARAQPQLLRSRGYEVRETRQHVGACVGTGFHSFAAEYARDWMQRGTKPTSPKIALEFGITTLRNEWRDPMVDDLTRRETDAQRQIGNMAGAHHLWAPPAGQPMLIERKFSFTLKGLPDVEITGTMDQFSVALLDGEHVDWKTGRNEPRSQVQNGGYASGIDALHGMGVISKPVTRSRIIWHRRLRPDAAQPPPTEIPLDVKRAKLAAHGTVRRLKRALDEFEETGDVRAFNANPNSRLCHQRFCGLWGTESCHAWR